MSDSYARACEQAATNQGLDPMTERLTREDISHQVEQTGGFTMVIDVPVRSGSIGITAEGPEQWLLVHLPDDVPEDADPVDYETELSPDASTDDAIAIIRRYLTD